MYLFLLLCDVRLQVNKFLPKDSILARTQLEILSLLLLCVEAVPEGFSVDIEPSENPLEQDQMSLWCIADNYTYEHLRWYRLDPRALEEEQGKSTHTAGLDCRSVHQYARALAGRLSFREASNSWTLDFTVASVRLQDEGHYVCEAQSRRSGEKQCLFRYVSVRGERWCTAAWRTRTQREGQAIIEWSSAAAHSG